MAQTTAQTDRDLASIHEARTLARRAKEAAGLLAELSQEQIDAIVDAMAQAATPQAEAFARLAHEETGYGVVADKIQKNLFASDKVYRFIRPMKTVGVVRRIDDRKVIEIAEPFGVVAAIVPSTNPTSTAIYKILISLKARCPIVISPHPAAVRCISRVAEVMNDAARRAGAPDGAISWMSTVTIEGTQELMKARETAVILATGGMGLVRAAYSAGKPAYGVGPGNAPAYIERSADVAKAVRDIVTGKTFDNGVLCSSENSVVVDAPLVEEVKRQFVANGAHFLSAAEIDAVGRVLVSPQRLPNPALVGPARDLHRAAGRHHGRPGDAGADRGASGVGRDYPLSIEKLCPVLSFYVVADWREGCERCKQILRYGGMGHTMSIHSRNDEVILQFGLKKPAYPHRRQFADDARVDRPLDRARTGDDARLRRLRRQHHVGQHHAEAPAEHQAPGLRGDASVERPSGRACSFGSPGLAEGACSRPRRLRGSPPDRSRGGSTSFSRPGATSPRAPALPRPVKGENAAPAGAARAPSRRSHPHLRQPVSKPLDFVCEDDVRQALRQGRKLVIGERTIVTPAARDFGESTICSSPRNGRGENPRNFVLPVEQIGVRVDQSSPAMLSFLSQQDLGFPERHAC